MLKILLLLFIALIIHNYEYNGYKAWANKTKNLFLGKFSLIEVIIMECEEK